MKIRLFMLSCVLAVAAYAADATGKWTAEVPGRGGNTMTTTITLKADGSNLTGSVSGRNGDTAIANGKVDGDTVSFDVTRETQNGAMTMHYTGKVGADEIKFKVERQGGEGQAREFTAKRASTT
jgi:predicted acyltransferase (DUF342 family)